MTEGETHEFELHHDGERGGEIAVHVAGRLTVRTAADVGAELNDLIDRMEPSRLVLDLSEVTDLDSAGALTIFELERTAQRRSIPVERRDPREAVGGMMRLLKRDAVDVEPHREPRSSVGLLALLGRTSIDIYRDFIGTMVFLGEFVLTGLYAWRHPRLFRPREVFRQIGRVGMEGLPLVGIISFMMGFVVALMAYDQLRKYGGAPVLPTVVAKAMVKQFSPLLTAILVAGRSGSAFAAEISSMQINDEVSALTIMGFNPVRFLALPRVLATLVAVPVLSVYGNLMGLLGGLVIGVSQARMSAIAYIHGVPGGISTADALESLIKSAVFGALIAGISCQRGFRARSGSEDVGASTTSAVVSSIFLIIFTDTLAALVVSKLGL